MCENPEASKREPHTVSAYSERRRVGDSESDIVIGHTCTHMEAKCRLASTSEVKGRSLTISGHKNNKKRWK